MDDNVKKLNELIDRLNMSIKREANAYQGMSVREFRPSWERPVGRLDYEYGIVSDALFSGQSPMNYYPPQRKEKKMEMPEKIQHVTGDPDFDEMLQKCCEILGVKGADYTVGSKDRLANFKRAAEMFGITQEQALMVYFYKHTAAVFNYAKSGGQSESEPIEGRIADVINYMLLFWKMIKEKKAANQKVSPTAKTVLLTG